MLYTPEKHITPDIETKASPSIGSQLSFVDFLRNGGHDDLSAYAAIRLFREAMPFNNAVRIRATAFSEIPPRLYDVKKKVYVDSHPVLELLAKPNAKLTQLKFLYNLAAFFDIVGESFLVATGRTEKPPLELINVSPACFTFSEINTAFGLLNIPRAIQIQGTYGSNYAYYSKDVKGQVHYINTNSDQELFHISSFNPMNASGNYRGLSPASAIWLELQQYIAGNRNNLSNLKRGTRLSMAWVNTGATELTSTQWERMQQESEKYKGDANAGGTPILDGMDVRPIQQSNRDMEFGKLQDTMLARANNIYSVPLALILDSSMTLNNLETAIVHLYDMAILPLATQLYSELTRFLMPRYPGSENLVLRYNEYDIPAVRTRLLESAKRLKEVGVNTLDEIRESIGDNTMPDGLGEHVLINKAFGTLSQIIEGVFDNAAPVPIPSNKLPADKGSAFNQFSKLMISCLDEKGERLYSDATIVEIASTRGLLDVDQ